MGDLAIELLQRLIATPSISRDESGAADVVESFLREQGAEPSRYLNNVWAVLDGIDAAKPTLLLNSHIDTVKPSDSYTFDPFCPHIADGKLYGLGSNDAGASVVSLIAAFLELKKMDGKLPVNVLLALTAEEEVMGERGMRAFLPEMDKRGIKIGMAIVGEPTGMQAAVAERGLVVLDCVAHGKTGHAARNEGVNAIYKAMEDIERLRSFRFDRESALLGPIKISVTQIEAGRQHNVVPDQCRFVVDVRTTDAYSNQETVAILQQLLESDAEPRSTRVQSSVISESHPLVQAAKAMGAETYVSPTTSDMALMSFPSLKIGPGQSARSHTADEYVMLDEIRQAIPAYVQLISNIKI